MNPTARLIAQLVFAVVFIAVLSLEAWQWWRGKTESIERPRPTVEALSLEMEKLPYGVDLIGNIKKFDRSSSIGVTGLLESTASPEQVVNRYKSVAPELGWTLFSEDQKSSRIAVFCKHGTSLTVESSPTGTGSQTHVGLVWTYHTASPAYCS